MEGCVRNKKNELWMSEKRDGLACGAVRGPRLGGTVPRAAWRAKEEGKAAKYNL